MLLISANCKQYISSSLMLLGKVLFSYALCNLQPNWRSQDLWLDS